MSHDDLTWRILVPVGTLSPAALLHWAESVMETVPPAEEITVFSATGEGMLHFEHLPQAIGYICGNGGLLSIDTDGNGDVLTLSVHLASGSLPEELEVLGDSANFDEIHVDIASRSVGASGAALRAFNLIVANLASALDAVFAWCISESSLEAAIPHTVRIHEFVARGILRPITGALAMAAPEGSTLSASLREQASSAGLGEATTISGWEEFREHGSPFGLA